MNKLQHNLHGDIYIITMGTGHEAESPYPLMLILAILCAQVLEMNYHYEINWKIYLTRGSAAKSLS